MVYGASANVCNTTVGVPPDCAEARGEFFDPTKSSTWQEGEQNELGLNHALGYQGVGQYGMLKMDTDDELWGGGGFVREEMLIDGQDLILWVWDIQLILDQRFHIRSLRL